MALLSDDADLYLRVGVVWVVSAAVAVAILRGWIRGPAFRPKKPFHLSVLVYSLLLAKHALKLRMVHGNNLPGSYYRCRCPGAAADGGGDAAAGGECVVVREAYVRDLLRVADDCYFLFLILCATLADAAVLGKRKPRVPGTGRRWCLRLRVVGRVLFETILFGACVFSCILSLPILLQQHHMDAAAAANGGDAVVASV